MSWVCSCCSNNNEDSDLTCLICGTAKPAAPAASETVCTLTQRRAAELCSYEDVTIPSEFNVIGENAFKGRTDLYSVQIHSGVKKIMKSAFEGCTNLSRVYYSGTISSIGARAFANCKHLSPDRRPSAERVASDAFVGCSPTPIPDPVRAVGARKSTSTSSAKSGGTATRTSSSVKTGGTATRPSLSATTEFTKSSSATKSTSTKSSASSTGSTTSSGTRSTTSSGGYRPAPTTGYRPAPSTSYTPPYTPTPVSLFEKTRWIILIVGILLPVAAFIFCEWGKLTVWTDWAYMLGLTLALVAAATCCVLSHDKNWRGICRIGTAGLLLAALLNWWFGAACLPIVAVLTLVIAITSLDGRCGVWSILLAVLSVALLVYSMIDHSYAIDRELWQTLISAAISTVLALVTVFILEDDARYEIGVGIQIVGFVITGCMLWWFGSACAVMVTLLSLAMATVGVVSAVRCIDDYDGGFGATHIVFSVLNLGLVVAAQLMVA